MHLTHYILIDRPVVEKAEEQFKMLKIVVDFKEVDKCNSHKDNKLYMKHTE